MLAGRAAADTQWVGSGVCAHAIRRSTTGTPKPPWRSAVDWRGVSRCQRPQHLSTPVPLTPTRFNSAAVNTRCRCSAPTSADPPQTQLLKYFVGSGSAARSFLLDIDGFLYEAPATWYSRERKWGFSPGYEKYSYPFLTRAITPGCLQCHATRLQPVAGTQNGYATPPFAEGESDASVVMVRAHDTRKPRPRPTS